MILKRQLEQGLDALHLQVDSVALDRLERYVEMLEKWNKTYNLTGARDRAGVLAMHVLDSLSIWRYVGSAAILDVGSGGGFPGIPLAIARPSLRVDLVDSNSKKTAFLRQVIIELGLGNSSVISGRIEKHRNDSPYPIIVSRAFSELADFIFCTEHLLARDGRWLAMKGIYPAAEIERLPIGILVDDVHRLVVPDVEGERHLVVLRRANDGSALT